jgi:hypothetical protein
MQQADRDPTWPGGIVTGGADELWSMPWWQGVAMSRC